MPAIAFAIKIQHLQKLSMWSQGLPKVGSFCVLHFMNKKRLVDFFLDNNQTTVLKRRTFPHLLIYALQCLLWVYFKEMQKKTQKFSMLKKLLLVILIKKFIFKADNIKSGFCQPNFADRDVCCFWNLGVKNELFD